jgi:hypothetical protein
MTPTELYEQLLNRGMFDIRPMACETTRFPAAYKNESDVSTSVIEFRMFFGILLLTGHNMRHCEKDLRCETENLGADCIQIAIPKNRHVKFKSYFRFVENNDASQNANGRAFKISLF